VKREWVRQHRQENFVSERICMIGHQEAMRRFLLHSISM
jgi:hypothetical protein